jgi:hypothetical protein
MRQHAYAARSVYQNDREGEGCRCAADDERLQGSLKRQSQIQFLNIILRNRTRPWKQVQPSLVVKLSSTPGALLAGWLPQSANPTSTSCKYFLLD